MCDVGKGFTRMITPSEKQTQFVRAVGETIISPLASAGVLGPAGLAAGKMAPTGNHQFMPALPGGGAYPDPGGGGGGDLMPILIIGGAALAGIALLMQ